VAEPPVPDRVAAARVLADRLWDAALSIDAADRVPVEVLDWLAAAGLYGVACDGPEVLPAVAEALGGASLSTAFVWVQHHSCVRAVADARPSVRDRWLDDLCAGRVRSGIAVAALRRPGPPSMVARRSGDGLVLDGDAPWVTGWGLTDVVLVAARDGDDFVSCLVDAVEGPALAAERVRLAAVDSSSTVVMHLRGHEVTADRVVAREPFEDWQARDTVGLGTNGFLGIGVASRCAHLLGSEALAAEVDDARRRLLAAGPNDMVAVRADVSLLAVKATTAVVAAGGGRSVERSQQAQRLAREAMFLLVFGQTRDIRAAQRVALGV
jgi:alkylation response protein AidB-like acyl-CoA dehydrogenase